MAQYVCDNCGATVTDEQFCPTCGSWVDPMREVVEEAEQEDYEEFSLGEPPPPEDNHSGPHPPVRVPRNEVQCPSCGSPNPSTNRHCEECGARLSQGTMPVAPRPAVQATAGVRAAMAIAGLLVGVVIIALLFNILAGDDVVASDTTVAGENTTTVTIPPAGPIEPLDVQCSVPGLSGFECANLNDDGDGEYQVNWEGLEEDQQVQITFIFSERTFLTGIVWENLPEGDRFYQNYRANTISVVDDDPNALPLTLTLDDQPGTQSLDYQTLPTLELTITVETAYLPQERNGQIFTELAILQIQPVGYPEGATVTTTTVAPTDTTEGG